MPSASDSPLLARKASFEQAAVLLSLFANVLQLRMVSEGGWLVLLQASLLNLASNSDFLKKRLASPLHQQIVAAFDIVVQ